MNVSPKLTPVLFVVAGAAWIGVIIDGNGILLLWPVLASFLAALAMARRPTARTSVPLAVASAFLGLTASAYQLVVSANLSGTPLAPAIVYSTPIFAILTLMYLFMIFLVLSQRPAAA